MTKLIFKDLLNEVAANLTPEIDELLRGALVNQSHDADFLLTVENGYYDPSVLTWQMEVAYSPYLLGPGEEVYSDQTHYEFIHDYRELRISNCSFVDHCAELEKLQDQASKNSFEKGESLEIQRQMLIYLKIWEADIFIKRLYQSVRLYHGEPYDWHFKLGMGKPSPKLTGTRSYVIRELIRDRIVDSLPYLHKIIKRSYIAQLRNSIAHSNYAIMGRDIILGNRVEGDRYNSLYKVPFEEWIYIFNATMVLYNEVVRLTNFGKHIYAEQARSKEGNWSVRAYERKDRTKMKLFPVKHIETGGAYGFWSFVGPNQSE